MVKSTDPRADAAVGACTAVKLKLKLKRVRTRATRHARAAQESVTQAWSAFPEDMSLSAKAGETASSSFYISNSGPADLQNLRVEENPSSERFSEESNCAGTLPAGQQCGIQVTYHAGTAAGTDEIALMVESDTDPSATKRVALRGTTEADGAEDGSGGSAGGCGSRT